MTTHITATVIGGMLKPDQSLHFPEGTRVTLTIQPISHALPQITPQEAWQAIKEWLKQRPLHFAGRRCTRDELHERR